MARKYFGTDGIRGKVGEGMMTADQVLKLGWAAGKALADKGITDPVYTLIVMLPCEYLWGWLAEQMLPTTKGNLYNFWITDNNSSKGAFTIGNFMHEYNKHHPIDRDGQREE